MDTDTKVRENRLRRMAERRGWQLVKSRRRDPRAWDYGTYGIIDPYTNSWVAMDFALGRGYGLDLDQIEERLTS
jgi:hypothetical protein